jgi:serine/threonine-protein kinase
MSSVIPEALAVGAIIDGKYRVDGVLGEGGMGIVVGATHLQLGQRVAIKFIRQQTSQDEHAVARFIREARAAVALSDEHVTRVLDVATLESGVPYMVMEYLAGVDLGQVLRRDGPLPVPLAVEFILQACEALAEAHSLGIVHRDLKPANLFVTNRPDGSPLVKVLDFGISKALDFGGPSAGESFTASGILMGSPGYMSPEQVRSAKSVDARTDLWSLGVILYELLSGLQPFVGETVGDTFAKIISEDAPPLRARRPDLPPGLVATVERCLERKVADRIQNVGELAGALLPFARGDAAHSVKRILRLSGQSGAETVAGAPAGATLEAADPAKWATGRPWLSSNLVPLSSSRLRVALSIAAVFLAIGAAGVVAIRTLDRTEPASLGSVALPNGPAVPAASIPSGAVPVPASEPSSLTEPGAAVAEPPPSDDEIRSGPEAGAPPNPHPGRTPRAVQPPRPPTRPKTPPTTKAPSETDIY